MSEKEPVPGIYFQHNPYGRIPHLLRPILVAPAFKSCVEDLSGQDCWRIWTERDFQCNMALDCVSFSVLPCSPFAGTRELRIFNAAEYDCDASASGLAIERADDLRFARLFHYCNSVAGLQGARPEDQLIVVVADPYLL